MSRHYLLAVTLGAALILVGGRCAPEPVAPVYPESTSPATNEPAAGSGEGEDLVGVKFVAYENRVQGYTILRPDNWYWRHYIKNEITGSNEGVVDYFIIDSKPLPGLGSEYLGQIVIEVSERPLADYADAVGGLTKSVATVGGESASRYAGKRQNAGGDGQAVVEYQFSTAGKTFRLILVTPAASASAEDIFEQVVASFKFKS